MEGKKTRIPSDLNFILEFMTIQRYRMFSRTSRNSRVSPRQDVEVYYNIIFGNYKFKGLLCIQWVCIGETANCRRYASCCYIWDSTVTWSSNQQQIEKGPFSKCSKCLIRKNFSLALGSPLFRRVLVSQLEASCCFLSFKI